jgi:ADP-heptose:LPS heptosyltransferase
MKIAPIEDAARLAPRTIGVLQLGKLGDTILTTPLFDALKSIYPAARLTMIGAAESAIIARANGSVDAVIESPRGFRQIPTLAARLRAARFDLYIDIKDHKSTTSKLIAELVHAGHVIAQRMNGPHDASLIDLPAPEPPGHYVDLALAPMRALAPGRRLSRRPSIEIPLEAFQAVDGQLNPGENGIVAVNISAGHPSRYWPPERWRHLVRDLATIYSVAILSTPADRPLADEICTTRREMRPIRTESILEAAAAIERSIAVITPDTSIVHLASALDKPCVGLYPPSPDNARVFAPLSRRHAIVMPPEGGTFQDIAIEAVMEAFNGLGL